MNIHEFASQQVAKEIPRTKDDVMNRLAWFVTQLNLAFDGWKTEEFPEEAINRLWEKYGNELIAMAEGLEQGSIRVRDAHQRIMEMMDDSEMKHEFGLQREMRRRIRYVSEMIHSRIKFAKSGPEEREVIKKEEAKKYVIKHTQNDGMTQIALLSLVESMDQIVEDGDMKNALKGNIYYAENRTNVVKVVSDWTRKLGSRAPFNIERVKGKGFIMRSRYDEFKDVVVDKKEE